MNQMPPNRCRIVLIAPLGATAEVFEGQFRAATTGGDIASIILPQGAMDEGAFQDFCERIVPIAQQAGIAAVVAGDTRIAGRVGADGIHVDGGRDELDRAIERFQPKMAVGAGGAKTRDDALELGEARPDYVFFGRFGYDTKSEPHPRNLTLGRWWAEMIEIPCVVLAGSDLASVKAVSDTGVEFVALSQAVFGEGADPAAAISQANAMLDEAPGFEAADI